MPEDSRDKFKVLKENTLPTQNSIPSENIFRKQRGNKGGFRHTKTGKIHKQNLCYKKYTIEKIILVENKIKMKLLRAPEMVSIQKYTKYFPKQSDLKH